jgi:membrane protein required for colicin V production
MSLDFTWIDYVVLVVVVASALLSLLRGLVKEIASLAVWVLAFVGASRLSHYAAEILPDWLTPPLMQTVGFLIVLVLILILGKLVTLALKELMNAAGVGAIDRTLGMLFGIVRGGLIVVVLGIMAAMTSLPKDQAWRNAKTKDFIELGIRTAAPWLPNEIERRLQIPKSALNWKEAVVCVA